MTTDELREKVFWYVNDVLDAPTQMRRKVRVEPAVILIMKLFASCAQRTALEARKNQLIDIFNPDDFALTYEIKQDTVRRLVNEIDSQLQELENEI